MKRITKDSAVLLGLTFIATALIACPATLDDRCAEGACLRIATDGNDGQKDGDPPDAPDLPTPPGCKEDADVASPEAKACAVDSFALFVDGTSGNDSKEGTKAQPLKSIGAALAAAGTTGKRRIYVCGNGPFAEHLKLTTAVNIFGGFACGSWTYNRSKAKVAPSDNGYVLHVENVSAAMTLSDLELVAPDVEKTKDGSSSIAAFVSKANVKFIRTSFAAGAAAAGADGAAGATGTLTSVSSGEMTLNGNAATTNTTPGALKECTCSNGSEKTTGGAGGNPTTGGGPGLPDLQAPSSDNGAAGLGSVTCNPNGFGHNGAPRPAAPSAEKITNVGILDGEGWKPQPGMDAIASGKPGQGGGGGGGRDATSAGGGGGCGGCGGTPGKGGQGGGASIALLANGSQVSLIACSLTTKAAGAGGMGGVGGVGGAGGPGGQGGTSGCAGGEGGRGGDGGSGGGGAGGVSVAILYKGAPPIVDSETQSAISTNMPGAGGLGGKAPDNNGPSGVSGSIKDATQL
jgi:hypothetical protein